MGLRALQPPLQNLDQAAAEASKTRLQSAMRGIGTQAPVASQQIAQAGAEAVQQQAQAVQRAQQTKLQLTEGVARQEQAKAQLDQREVLNQRRAALTTSLRKAEDTLTKLGMSTKQQLFDTSLQFEQDELGRTVFNERQLMDYAVTHAKDIEQLQDYEQAISQMSERRMRLLQVAQQTIEMEMKQAFQMEQSALNQEHKLALAKAEQAIKEKIAKEKADAANRAGLWGAVTGTIAAVGAVALGQPQFAPAAFSIGSGLGTLASTKK